MAPNIVIPARTFTIRRRSDGRYVTQNDVPGDRPVAVDESLNTALENARREAALASHKGKCRVIIKAQNEQGKLEQVDVVEPPLR